MARADLKSLLSKNPSKAIPEEKAQTPTKVRIKSRAAEIELPDVGAAGDLRGNWRMFVIGTPDTLAIDIFSTPIPMPLSDIVGKGGYFFALSRLLLRLAYFFSNSAYASRCVRHWSRSSVISFAHSASNLRACPTHWTGRRRSASKSTAIIFLPS